MGFTIGALCVILLSVFIVQIGKARELASIVRNDPAEQDEINKFQAGLGLLFMVAFLLICVVSFVYYIPTSLGWGAEYSRFTTWTRNRLFIQSYAYSFVL